MHEAFFKAIPPPGTMPSLIAAFVAHIASSTLACVSCNSSSELAPTFTIATLAESLANLASNLWIIRGAIAFLSCFSKFFINSLIESLASPICKIVSASSVTLFKHSPKCSGPIKSISSPKSSLITVAPVSKAKSFKVSFLLIP